MLLTLTCKKNDVLAMPQYGITTERALSHIPDYLQDPKEYKKWMAGEDVLPPEMKPIAQPGAVCVSVWARVGASGRLCEGD